MADTKITALTAITTVDPAVDVLPIVDVSDTTMAASGTTKKITSNQILGAGGTATLASATITGDLTVDTSTLKVDSANNRVGIGTLGAYGRLTVGVGSGLQAGTTTNVAAGLFDIDYASTGDINTRLSFVNSNGVTNAALDRIGNSNFNDSGVLAFLTRSGAGSLTERYRIAADGVATWSNVGGFAGTAMTLNSTGLGVGSTPAAPYRILSAKTSGGGQLALTTGAAAGSNASPLNIDLDFLGFTNETRARIRSTDQTSDTGNGFLSFWTQNSGTFTEKMRLSTEGNVGIGVTPSGSGGCLQLKSGITFPAAQVASSDANTLDDYEEGTWTATLKGSVSNPTTPVTATGRYTKIGRQVSIQLFVNNVTTTGASGRIQIDGLPFANNGSVEAISNVGFYNMATFTGVPFGLTSASSTVVDMWSSVSAGVFQAVNYNPGSVQYVWVNLTYTV